MQYNTQRVFHFESLPRTYFSHAGGEREGVAETSNTRFIFSGLAAAWFPVHIIWCFGWCQSPSSNFFFFFAAVKHTTQTLTDPQHRLRQQPQASLRVKNSKRKSKLEVEPMWGWLRSPLVSPESTRNAFKVHSHDSIKASRHLWL